MQSKHVISSKVFYVFKNGQKKCPKLTFPKNFPQNNMFSSTGVGKFSDPNFLKFLHGCRKNGLKSRFIQGIFAHTTVFYIDTSVGRYIYRIFDKNVAA